MIRKSLILATLLMFSVSGAMAAESATTAVPTKKVEQVQNVQQEAPKFKEERPEFYGHRQHPCPKAKADFEKRLKLTDEQKELARQIRMKGHEEMKPIMDKMRLLKQQKETILKTKISEEMQREKIAEIDAQLNDLRKKAHELRIKNMKEFENILTDKQKKELKKLKAEGRKNFEKTKNKCQKSCKCSCPSAQPRGFEK